MVATDVPGCREITIDGKTGLLVPPDDPVALADAIEHLAASPELRARYGAAARRLAVERFSAEAIGRATVALYTRLAMAGDAVDPRGGAALSSSGSGTQGSRTI
jgi:glycosyltransferase involved in cell wall biosynthesis